MKLRPTTKMILSVIGIGAAIWLGMEGWALVQTGSASLEPVEPGRVNLIVVDPNTGYSVRVANSVAQLVPVSSTGLGGSASGAQEGQSRRLPIRELIASFNGDSKALSYLTESVNDLNQEDDPLSDVVWSADDIRLALEGDPAKKQKLEADLNMHLDGKPLSSVGMYAVRNGITVEVPLSVKVPTLDKPVGTNIRLRYQPRFCKELVDVIDKRFNPSQGFVVGTYTDQVKKLMAAGSFQNIADELKNLIAEDRVNKYSAVVEKILPGIVVMVNDSMIESASLRTYKDEKQRDVFSLLLNVDDTARRKLWKYSRQTKDFALIVVVDGVAVAAPKIGTQLAERTVVIDGLKDKRLVTDSVDKINQATQARTKQ